jgi:hypothetical protein
MSCTGQEALVVDRFERALCPRDRRCVLVSHHISSDARWGRRLGLLRRKGWGYFWLLLIWFV